MELKKSYRGFIWCLLGYLALCFGPIPFLPEWAGERIMVRYIMNITNIFMAVLCGVMWKTEAIYWMNGTTYEEAVKAGSQRRKEFARKHFDLFFWFALLYLLFSVLMYLLHVSFWVDFTVGTVGICAVAISTVRIKL